LNSSGSAGGALVPQAQPTPHRNSFNYSSNGSNTNPSPLYYQYQQNASTFKGNNLANPQNKKSLNLQSPVFVPGTGGGTGVGPGGAGGHSYSSSNDLSICNSSSNNTTMIVGMLASSQDLNTTTPLAGASAWPQLGSSNPNISALLEDSGIHNSSGKKAKKGGASNAPLTAETKLFGDDLD
jgi:hypothetical protein